MRRDLRRLADTAFDLLVVGAGIHGACVAWDASLRGLSVALIEKGDFGGATSANSLKIIHGGLRYLQSLDFARMRQSIEERSTLVRIAPHLVRPMPFMIPTRADLKSHRRILDLALRVNDWVGFDRNRLAGYRAEIPAGRTAPLRELLAVFPHLASNGLTGAAVWYDCFVHDSERLTLAFVRSAVHKGAVAANYAEATGIEAENGPHLGVRVRDRLNGDDLLVRARVVVNAAGPWVDEVAARLRKRRPSLGPPLPSALAVNLISKRVLASAAVGFRSKSDATRDPIMGGGRFIFLVPWRGHTLIGTSYRRFVEHPDLCRPTEEDIQGFIDECNEACPGLELDRSVISFVHAGVLPLRGSGGHGRSGALANRPVITDRWAGSDTGRVLSVVGVKYTTARAVASQVVDRVFFKLGVSRPPACRTRVTPLVGGEAAGRAAAPCGDVPVDILDHWAASYGSLAPFVAAYTQTAPGWAERVEPGSPVTRGEVLHAVREEMAVKLVDVVLRRTGLGTARCPSRRALETVADVMGGELSWTRERRNAEIAELLSRYPGAGGVEQERQGSAFV